LEYCSKNTKPFPGCKVKGFHSDEIPGEYRSNGQWILQIYLSKLPIYGHPGGRFGKHRLKLITHVVQLRALRYGTLSNLGAFLFCLVDAKRNFCRHEQDGNAGIQDQLRGCRIGIQVIFHAGSQKARDPL
jgi:hypothetical protein